VNPINLAEASPNGGLNVTLRRTAINNGTGERYPLTRCLLSSAADGGIECQPSKRF